MRILGVTDLNSVGSGYASLSLPIFDRLVKRGYEVKVIGLANQGTQHNFPFSIIPAQNTKETEAMIHNLWNDMWTFDVMMVLMDIPFHRGLLNRMQEKPFKYIGVFPVEADPLSFSWAMTLMQMDKQYVISEFGVEECHKKGVFNAEYLPVGIETAAWRPPEKEERSKIRQVFGFDEETFSVLTVADNQERKNLPSCFDAFAQFSQTHPNSRYMLITREQLYAGWDIQELASRFGIQDKLMIFERGLPFKDLWMVYAASDAFLLLSKAEGRGLPIAEAMAMRIPCIGTDCTGIRDQLKDGRGFLVSCIHQHIDPFGTAHRYWADPEKAAYYLLWIKEHPEEVQKYLDRAQAFVSELTWDRSVDVIDNYLKGLVNGEAA